MAGLQAETALMSSIQYHHPFPATLRGESPEQMMLSAQGRLSNRILFSVSF